jgi:hypothetical protein
VNGVDHAAGSAVPDESGDNGEVSDSGSPEVAIAADGTLYIVWTATIKFVKSTDRGDSFSQPAIA